MNLEKLKQISIKYLIEHKRDGIIILVIIIIMLFTRQCTIYSVANQKEKVLSTELSEKSYYLTLTQEKDFITYFKAQLYLNDCKENAKILYPNIMVRYKNDSNFKKAFDNYHNVYYFKKKQLFKYASRFNNCKKQDAVDILTIIGEKPTPRFIESTIGLEQINSLTVKQNNHAN